MTLKDPEISSTVEKSKSGTVKLKVPDIPNTSFQLVIDHLAAKRELFQVSNPDPFVRTT